MTLIDLAEMIADWKAAERRSPDKKLADTLDYAFKKYGVGEQLGGILRNTMSALCWIEDRTSCAPGSPAREGSGAVANSN